MAITLNDIEPISYLAGFHLRKSDYNFKSFSGELFNHIRDILDIDFDVIPVDDNLYILKSPTEKKFSIRYEIDRLIYEQGQLPYEKFENNAFEILKGWQRLNVNANILRLAGILYRFQLKLDPPKGTYKSRVYDNFFKDFGLSEKKKKVDFHVNYVHKKAGREYNINLNIDENLHKKYNLEIRLDVNDIDEDGTKKIGFDKAKDIFKFADEYLKNEFTTLLSFEENGK